MQADFDMKQNQNINKSEIIACITLVKTSIYILFAQYMNIDLYIDKSRYHIQY